MELTSAYTQSTEAVRVAIDEGTERAVVDPRRHQRAPARRASDVLGPPARRQPPAPAGRRQRQRQSRRRRGRACRTASQQIEALLVRDRDPDRPRLGPGGRSGRRAASGLLRRHPAGAANSPRASTSAAAPSPTAPASSCDTLTEAAAALERVEARMGDGALQAASRPSTPCSAASANARQDLESVTRSFTTSLEGSLQNAEAKARQIGSVLAAAAETTTSAIGEQFERIRATTGAESERTAAALRTAYEQAAAEMAEALSGATAKFRDTMGELRGMTGQIQRELESHPRRTAPRRRRAAAGDAGDDRQHAPGRGRPDQGPQRALRSGVPLQPGGRCGSRRPAARAVNESPGRGHRGRPSTAAVRAAHRAGRRQPAPAPVDVPARRNRKPAPLRPCDRPRHLRPCAGSPAASVRPRAGRKPPAREAGARGGWLSDLLNRASRDETAEPAARPAGRPDRVPGQQPRIPRLDLGRHRPHDRPRRRRGALGPLQARREQRLHPPPLHAAGPADLRRDPPQVSPRRRSSSRRSTATWRSSSACSPRSPATTATPC